MPQHSGNDLQPFQNLFLDLWDKRLGFVPNALFLRAKFVHFGKSDGRWLICAKGYATIPTSVNTFIIYWQVGVFRFAEFMCKAQKRG